MFKYLAISLTALTVASAFPLHPRSPPPYRSCDYLEEYDTYLARFNALDCGSKASADVDFYVECCYPLHKTESLADKPAKCTPPPPPSDTIAAEPPAETGAPAPAPEAPANPAPAPPSNGGNDGGYNGGNGGGDNGNGGSGGGDNGNPGNGGGGGGDDDDDEDCTEEPETPTSTSAPEPSEAPANPAPEPSEAPSSEAPAPSSEAPAPSDAPAPEPSSSEPAPPQESQPPSNGGGDGNVHTGGFATFFYQNGNAGACGEKHNDGDMIAAISEQVYGYDYSKKSEQCGKRVRVTNNNNGKSVEVVIVDSCPSCVNNESLDLSYGAFTSIAPESDGMVPITWQYI